VPGLGPVGSPGHAVTLAEVVVTLAVAAVVGATTLLVMPHDVRPATVRDRSSCEWVTIPEYPSCMGYDSPNG
jgi:hypothetical protein